MNMQDYVTYICNQRAKQLETLVQDYLKLNPDLTREDLVIHYYPNGNCYIDRKNTDE